MNTIQAKQTYLGMTAHQWAESAECTKSLAGIPEVFSNHHILDVTDNNTLAVMSTDGCKCLVASPRTINKIRKMRQSL